MTATKLDDLDLWPADLEPKGEPSPSAILRQQGYRLGERTQDVVYGEVESRFENGKFAHKLTLHSPQLRVQKPIVELRHDPSLYPTTFHRFKDGGTWVADPLFSASTADEVRDRLRDVFGDPNVVLFIQSLIAQARDLDEEAA